MRIGLAQMAPVLGAIDQNIENMHEFVRRACAQNVDLLVFPELCVTGYSLGQIDGDVSLSVTDARLQSLVMEAGDMSLAFGFPEDGGLRTYNSAVYFESDKLLHVHRKLYLPTYGTFEERKHFSPGRNMRAFQTKFGSVAMMVCYDAWQPVLPFLAVQDGAVVLVIPTNSGSRRSREAVDNIGYWLDTTRFYGRMFECFVVFVNRVGREGNDEYWGRSHVVNPAGEVVAQARDWQEQLLTADVDLQEVREWRRRVPLVREARLAMLRREFDRLLETGGDL